jgi:hypothetical protein
MKAALVWIVSWAASKTVRRRFSNAFDGVYVGLHASAGSLVAGTNRPVSFVAGTPKCTAASHNAASKKTNPIAAFSKHES